MGLRIFGAIVAVLLAAFAFARYRKGQLRRGESLLIGAVSTALAVAAIAPGLLDPVLSALGFQAGQERRIIGLLVLSEPVHSRSRFPWIHSRRHALCRARRPRRLRRAQEGCRTRITPSWWERSPS